MKKQIFTLMTSTVVFGANPVFGMMGGEEDTYGLATGKSASKRLDLQHDVVSATSYEHLKKAGLSKGQTVWDIGCGGGAMTVYLAKEVGETGKVYAIDMSEEQLIVAREKVKSEGLTNVTFFQGDIRTLKGLPLGMAHIAYMRFVLMHVKDPGVVIGIAKSLLKDGGVAVSQESIWNTSFSSSNQEFFKEYDGTYIALGEKLGVDYNIGSKLELLYTQAGYVNTEIYYIQPKVNMATVKQYLPLDLADWKKRAIDAGVLTLEKVAEWESMLCNWSEDDPDFCYAAPKQAYALSWK